MTAAPQHLLTGDRARDALNARNARIIELWNLGHSATAVARLIGHGATKNTVIGIIDRARKRGVDVDSRRAAR